MEENSDDTTKEAAVKRQLGSKKPPAGVYRGASKYITTLRSKLGTTSSSAAQRPNVLLLIAGSGAVGALARPMERAMMQSPCELPYHGAFLVSMLRLFTAINIRYLSLSLHCT
jgi:hypothetical protein